MLFRLTISLLGLLLSVSHAAAQDDGLTPPPELFDNVTDSSVVEHSFSVGYLDASTVIIGRAPGTQVKLWRRTSEIAREDMFVPELLWLRFGVNTVRVDVDTLVARERAYFAGYNAAVEGLLKREYGADVFEKIKQESRVQYRLYKGEEAVGSEDEHE